MLPFDTVKVGKRRGALHAECSAVMHAYIPPLHAHPTLVCAEGTCREKLPCYSGFYTGIEKV